MPVSTLELNRIKKTEFALAKGLIPKVLYRYMSFKKHTEDIIKNSSFLVQNPKTFNDPFDCQLEDVSLAGRITSAENGAKVPAMVGILEEAKDKILREAGVLCFSKTNASLLMWAHYCESHSGFTMTFDATKDTAFFTLPFKVKYTPDYPVIEFLNDPGRAVVAEITTKSDHWIYEEEIRVIKMHTGIQSFAPACLTAITMGLRITSDNEMKLKEWLSVPAYTHVQLYRAVKADKKYGIDFHKA